MTKRFGLIIATTGMAFLAGLPAGHQVARPEHASERRHALPDRFTPVDTGRRMGVPDPLPLEAERAFPDLKFERPVELTHAGDGTDRLFVLEQPGVVRVFENRAEAKTAKVFLDLRDVVLREGNEEGLLGLAFHPRYRDNGELFVYYTTRPRSSVVVRFRVSKGNPDRADRGSAEELLRIDQPYENHNGGSMRFGPDGFLYVGLGDGGSANDPHAHGQNLGTLLGSILRIDVDRRDPGRKYAVPPDNPFVGRRDARGEIWAYGLRNVWRLAFDRKTGDLWAGDVGQDRFEEVNLIRKGGNYGWNLREGFHPFDPASPAKPPDLIDPVVEYHREDGQSVTGGLVYRGERLKDFAGAYFYGDYLSGKVWALRWDGARVVANRQVAATGLNIAAFGEDQNGEMYLCAGDGHLYRLRPRDVDLKAVAAAFPRTLSATGLFASVKDHEPAPGLIPYEVNFPFWTDYTIKDRYVALPKAGAVTFHEQKKWEFPVGTVFVKTFWLHRDRANLRDPVRLETRLFVHSPDGWVGYTYVYNDDRTEAHLLDGAMIRPVEVKTAAGRIDQRYYFPSRTDCMACHTKAAGFVLGPNTRQMNRTLHYRGERRNQITLLNDLGVFTEKVKRPVEELERFPEWGFGNHDRSPADGRAANTLEPPTGDPAALARAWLEVNCAVCHQPDGIGPGGRDMRYHTPLAKMKLVGEKPAHEQLSLPGGRLVTPGEPHASELVIRVGRRGPGQMPPVGTNLVDPRGLDVLQRWIAGMEREAR